METFALPSLYLRLGSWSHVSFSELAVIFIGRLTEPRLLLCVSGFFSHKALISMASCPWGRRQLHTSQGKGKEPQKSNSLGGPWTRETCAQCIMELAEILAEFYDLQVFLHQ